MEKYNPDSVNNHSFDYQARTRIVFGDKTLEELGGIVKDLNGSKAILVTDPGLLKTGHPDKAKLLLAESGIKAEIFSDVVENPTAECVKKCAHHAKSFDADVLIGLGGGSAMDTAKGANFLVTNGGEIADFWGFGKATKPMLPMIAIPTTAGTGSECQSFALISADDTHMKMACGDFKAAPKVALLDPELTLTLPASVTAHTGIDAIAHAVEAAVCKLRNPFSTMYAQRAFELTINSLPLVLKNPDNLEARGKMLLGAAFAGMAIENSMLGAAHSLANPLTAHFNLIHGIAVGVMLPRVVEFNSQETHSRKIYSELVNIAALKGRNDDEFKSVSILTSTLNQLLHEANISAKLSDHGVSDSMISRMASDASKQWTKSFNPRDISELQFANLYQSAF